MFFQWELKVPRLLRGVQIQATWSKKIANGFVFHSPLSTWLFWCQQGQACSLQHLVFHRNLNHECLNVSLLFFFLCFSFFVIHCFFFETPLFDDDLFLSSTFLPTHFVTWFVSLSAPIDLGRQAGPVEYSKQFLWPQHKNKSPCCKKEHLCCYRHLRFCRPFVGILSQQK